MRFGVARELITPPFMANMGVNEKLTRAFGEAAHALRSGVSSHEDV